jgi:hypothetical protein
LELIDQPSQPYSFEIRTIIIECFSRLQTNSSPIIGRACQVLEYFLDPSQPRVGIPKTYEGALTEWQELETQDQSFNWQPDDPTRESRFEWFPPPAAAGQRDTTLSLSANPAFPADARDLCYPTKPSSDMAGESHGTPMLDSCYPLNPSPEQSSEIHSTPVLGLCYPLKPSHEQTADVQGLDFCYPLQQRVEQTSDAHGNPVLNWTCPPFS